jgi:hypothetical protein
MRGRLAILITLTLLISGFYYYSLTYNPPEKKVVYSPGNRTLHLATEDRIAISNVDVKVVYFTPIDLEPLTNWSWNEKITNVLTEVKDFYKFQLGNNISFNVYPKVIVGKEIHGFYDGEKTDNGNPNALISVREEVLKRVFSTSGDLYDSQFVISNRGRFQILLIVYEGTGASAMIYQNSPSNGTDVVTIETDGPPAIILSSAYLNSAYYTDFGSTILAHEIGHSFGLSDSSDLATGAYKDNDLMGAGRRRTIDSTYISDKNKKLLGLE